VLWHRASRPRGGTAPCYTFLTSVFLKVRRWRGTRRCRLADRHTRHVTAPRTLQATMINMNRLRELTAELGFIPATTDAAAIDGRE
jgi:hypothetical protein